MRCYNEEQRNANRFGKDCKLRDNVDERGISVGSYAKAMKELSVELKTEFVDMNHLTHDLLEKVGKDESMKFFVISTGLVKSKDGEPAGVATEPQYRAGGFDLAEDRECGEGVWTGLFLSR